MLDVRTPRNIPPKLHANRWTGPWKVVQVISSCVYRVQKDGARKAIIVNIDRLAPFIVPDVQRFPKAEDETSNGDITEHEHVDTPLAMAEADGNETRVESDHASQEEEESVHEPRVTRRAQRRRRPPARLNDYVINNDNDDDDSN